MTQKHPVLGTDEPLRHVNKTEQDKLPAEERRRVHQHGARLRGKAPAPELEPRQHHGDGDEALPVMEASLEPKADHPGGWGAL